MGRHNRLNAELCKILGYKIPDIRLACNCVKDSVIYTDIYGAYEWYKSCGTSELSTIYDADYILTGDKKIFDFYNLLVTTVAVLRKINKDFNSVSILRDGFCEEYLKNNPDEPKDEIKDKFDYFFDNARENKLILGRSYYQDYSPSVWLNHYVGMEKYMDEALQYVNTILNKVDDKKNEYCKKIKK